MPASSSSNDHKIAPKTLGKRKRKENGLVTLTNKFISLVKSSPNMRIDLN